MPDGTSRFSLDGKPIHHYMGCSTFANFTVLPEIALAKVNPDAPFDKICYIGCGVTTGIGAVINTAKAESAANAVVFGLGGIGLNVIQGLRLIGADMIVGVDLNNSQEGMGRALRHDPFRQPESEVDGDLVPYRVDLTNRRRRLLLRVHRQREGDAPGARMRAQGLGRIDHHRRGRPAQEISTRPFQLVTGRSWKGTAFGGARGRTDVPKIVDWYMDGKIEIDPMITHKLALDEINKGFDLMHKAFPHGNPYSRGIARAHCRPFRRRHEPTGHHGPLDGRPWRFDLRAQASGPVQELLGICTHRAAVERRLVAPGT
jgi:S-(hydroxymethyl)glutathione dehydrogenase/alcohol dehydrogenase